MTNDPHDDLTCREIADFLMAYLADELPGRQRASFENHLRECEDCVAYVKTYQQTIALGKAATADPDAPAREDVPEDLIQAILAARIT